MIEQTVTLMVGMRVAVVGVAAKGASVDGNSRQEREIGLQRKRTTQNRFGVI